MKIIFLVLTLISISSLAELCDLDFLSDKNALVRLNKNEFNHFRRLSSGHDGSYYELLPKSFQQYLASLNHEHIWLDVGAGEAGAIREYLHQFSFRSRAATIALVYRRPESVNDAILNATKAKYDFKYLEGKFFEEYAADELPKVDLITDVYGAISYSQKLDLVIEKMLTLLKPGGRLYFATSVGKTTVMGRSQVGGMDLFLSKVRGVKITSKQKGHVLSFDILRTAEPLHVPKLDLKDYTDGTPSIRKYYMNE